MSSRPLVDEIEQVQHASGSAVAVDKRMDRLELIMHDRKPDQWVDLLDLVNVALPIGQFAPENVLSLRRRVDDLVGCIVYQRRSRRVANIQLHSLDRSTDFDSDGGRNRPSLQHLETTVQGGAVAQGLFGGRVRSTRRVVGVAEQPVRRRDDVFDLGTRLRFEQGDRVDQHRLVRDEIPGDAELRQCRARGNATPKNGLGLGFRSRWQVREVIEGTTGIEGHVDVSSSCRHIFRTCRFRRHVISTCRRNENTSTCRAMASRWMGNAARCRSGAPRSTTSRRGREPRV